MSLGRAPNERFEVMITLLEKEIKEPNAYGSFEGLKEREKEFGGENQPMETGEPTEAVVPRQEERKEHRYPKVEELCLQNGSGGWVKNKASKRCTASCNDLVCGLSRKQQSTVFFHKQ